MFFTDYTYNFIDKNIPDNTFKPDIDKNIYTLDDIITLSLKNLDNVECSFFYNNEPYKNNNILSNNNFIADDIKNDIILNFNQNYIISFKYNNISVKLVLVYSKSPPSPNLINNLVSRIYMLLILTPIDHGIKDELNITIYLTNFKKKFSSKKSIIGINNVNSGCTIKLGDKIGEIFIWRIEECEKVLMHELIHALGIDFHYQSPEVLDKIHSCYDISDKNYINLFEVYTETWAVIFNIYINSLSLNNKKFLSNFYWWETYYSIIQSVKILKYFGYSRFDDCNFYCPNFFKKKQLRFRQKTSVLSYYIFKSILLYNIEKFINFCFKQNPERPWLFKSSDDKFYQLIEDCIINSNYIDIINQLLTKDYKFDTLRMILFEIKK